MTAIDLSVQAAGNKILSNFLATDDNMLDNVYALEEQGINWQKTQQLVFDCDSTLIYLF